MLSTSHPDEPIEKIDGTELFRSAARTNAHLYICVDVQACLDFYCVLYITVLRVFSNGLKASTYALTTELAK